MRSPFAVDRMQAYIIHQVKSLVFGVKLFADVKCAQRFQIFTHTIIEFTLFAPYPIVRFPTISDRVLLKSNKTNNDRIMRAP
jgi:hypothetical protein